VDGLTVAFAPDGTRFLTSCDDGTLNGSIVHTWKTPAPLEGKPERIRVWIATRTGTELKGDSEVHILSPEEWQQRRKQLEEWGGPP
jgi:hypothetical protein